MPNRLAESTSPYLRQHRDNPVDWYEWGEAAFAEARRRDVPVLLSVGYSACHWCHVMAHESFEDTQTAGIMNGSFVNVKVDREERPDVDAVYMEAVQALTGHGGWPMTVWLTPEGRPFYAGTYFPKEDRHGMPSFQRVMQAVTEAWTERRDEIGPQADRLVEAISRSIPPSPALPSRSSLAAAFSQLAQAYDPVHGGMGDAPKFPQEPVLEFLLRVAGEEWAPRPTAILSHTLIRMARGGIYDQLGGGFSRYSVDAEWLVPHFEKMLYNNAQLARIYVWAWRELGVDGFRDIAEETLEYMRRDLRNQDGGFYSAEDADSEGVEGKFYVWSHDEFRSVVGDGADIAADHWGVSERGNFEGANILHVAMSFDEVAARHGIDRSEVVRVVSDARAHLLEARGRRVRPGLDHKVVAAWNGLAIRAFAEAGATLGRADLIADARACARFILDRMRMPDGRLYRSWSEGEARVTGFLEDHASVAMGLFALYRATGELEWFGAAESLTRLIPRLFSDPDGGFFSTAFDGEALVKRPKDQMDNPSPSGNSLAAEALWTLHAYTAEPELREQAEATIRSGALLVDRYPSAAGHLMAVVHSMSGDPKELAVTGPEPGPFTARVWERFNPDVTLAVDTDGSGASVVPLLADRYSATATRAFVCRDFVCELPTTDPELMTRLLRS
jgi:uncharacterized protein YyaL (SSP411 family)